MSLRGGEQIKFSVMESLFKWIQKTKPSAKKRSKFRKFLDAYCKNPDDYFSTIRLILPGLDRERGSYGLKEHAVATCLIDALGMSRDSPDALRLLNWRKAGPKAGDFAGNFSLVAANVLQSRLGSISPGITVKEVNDLLDRLAAAENRGEKTSVLSELIRKTNAQEMKWIIMIILKDLKLGISEKTIFHEFHPDAEDLFNVTCDLKLVCEKLRDRTQRHKRQDIEVGKPVRPQLALRVSNAVAAWKKLHGKEVVVECKFDGDRIQIHKNKTEIHFFSRNFLDHQEYAHGMSDIIAQNILVDRCILDGEMLVWDTSANHFAEFGSNQEIAKAAKEGLDSDRQLCYVAFDILYVGDTSVIHQTLKERHELLQKVVKPIKGRLEILIPHGGLNAHCPPGEPCWSLIPHSVDEVEKFFKETIENRDEGIVLKDLGSKWEPSDRSAKWMKLKPEYVRAGSDLDVLIIGGYYGSGRRGGEVAQFLVGLAERPAPNTYPRRFLSFCRVGTGLSDEELNAVVTKLKPYFRKYEYPKKTPPSFYQVTNHSKERPDVWIESPEKSIILTVTSDIRMINSEVFAAPYSLRFPRIDHVRFDKPWHECLDVGSFVELVHSSNGTTQKSSDYSSTLDRKPKRVASSRRGEKTNTAAVLSHFIQTDVSQIKSETSIFSNMVFYFVNVPSSHSLDSLHKMVVEHGGTFSMNLNNSVTHCIAAESKGIKFKAATHHGDVIHCSWLFDCCSLKKLLPLQPKYFLFLSDLTRKRLQEEIDEFSDSYFFDMNLADLRQLLSNMDRTEDSKNVAYYKKKYCPKDKWMLFHDCSIYFYLPMPYMETLDSKVLLEFALRRMKLEVSFGGGKVSDALSHATHLVVMSLPDTLLDFNVLLSSFSAAEKHLIHSKRVHVVRSQWLEDCFNSYQKLPEQSYSLKPSGVEESMAVESDHDPCVEDYSRLDVQKKNSSSDKAGNPSKREATLDKSRIVTLPSRSVRRKRVRITETRTAKIKPGRNQPQRKRARVGSKPAKIFENESDGSALSNDQTVKEFSEKDTGNGGRDMLHEQTDKYQVDEIVDDSGLSERVRTPEGQAVEYSGSQDRYDESHVTESGNENSSKNDEKLGHMEDPVQAMLLDMIPTLGTTRPESSEDPPQAMLPDMTPALGTKIPESLDPVPRDSKSLPDPNPKPEKKKKVSYKDVASELLKDW